MRRLLVLLLFLVIFCSTSFSAFSQNDDPPQTFPTVDAIQDTIVPIANRIALAERLRGVDVQSLTVTPPPVPEVGQTQTFWVQNATDDLTFSVQATAVVIGEHLIAWVAEGTPVVTDHVARLVQLFDEQVYDAVRALWGSEPLPGIDGDTRAHVLFTGNLGNGIGAYFAARHAFPEGVTTNSNQREMFFYNTDSMPTSTANDIAIATLAHEFQHMIRFAVDDNDPAWVDEGFSSFTELYLGYDTALWTIESYLNNPEAQLNSWRTDNAPISAHYGASALFMTYLYDRFGIEAMQALSEDPQDSLTSVEHVLAMFDTTMDDFFAEWLITNALRLSPAQQLDTPYTYRSLTLPQPPATVLDINRYPTIVNQSANQYSGAYFDIRNLSDTTQITLRVDAPETVPLIPVDAYSGAWMWYSHRGDSMDSTLTRAFDLTDVDSATLNFRVWYDIENGWDYGYVMASVNGGATWDILQTDTTTDFNPYGNAYGSGFTGQSGAWMAQSVSLETYVGEQVQLRFEMITDEALNLNNMAIDDVSIPEVGYFSDFEQDGGGWDADGWMRIDNRLPQRYHLIVIYSDGESFEVWQAIGTGETSWTIPVNPSMDAGWVILAPMADVTTVPMPYTLQIVQE